MDTPPRDGVGGRMIYDGGGARSLYAKYNGISGSYEGPAPPDGIHTLRFWRFNQSVRAYFDDQLLLSGDNIPDYKMRYVFLLFGGRDNSSFEGLHVDYIEVTEIPEPRWPHSLAGLAVVFILATRSSRT